MRQNICLALCLFLTAVVVAPAHADEPPEGTVVHLDVTERAEVTQNLLMARLSLQVEGPDARTLQNEMNKTMTRALRTAKGARDVDVSTGHYNVRPQYKYISRNGDRERVLNGWQGSQSLTLESQQAETLLSTVADLQGMGLAMNSLNYQVTPELEESTRNSLLEKAVLKLRTKAERVASALGKAEVSFQEISVGGSGNRPRPMRMMASAEGMKADMAAPVADPGESDITLNVSAKVLIK